MAISGASWSSYDYFLLQRNTTYWIGGVQAGISLLGRVLKGLLTEVQNNYNRGISNWVSLPNWLSMILTR